MKKIILSADSTCDLSDELKEKYQVFIQPLTIILGDKHYKDGVDIKPDDIYEHYQRYKVLSKTSAPNPAEYIQHFKKWTDEGHDVIHISLGSAISASYQNACIAAEELGNVYPIDSGNLSNGSGLLVLEAADRIAKGMSTKQISEEINALRSSVHASFVINSLTYLHAGGRCSALQKFGANTLNIKPLIEVNNEDASMTIGKKYRGSLQKAIRTYTEDKLANRDDLQLDRVFITHSGAAQENLEMVRGLIKELADFEEILDSRAGCTISSHCGPDTLGVFFMTK